MKILKAWPDKLDVLVSTNCGTFRCHPEDHISGPNILADAPKHQTSPTAYSLQHEKPTVLAVPPGARQYFEVPEDWCANLRIVYEAACATDAFNR
jgi:hypothetical protein